MRLHRSGPRSEYEHNLRAGVQKTSRLRAYGRADHTLESREFSLVVVNSGLNLTVTELENQCFHAGNDSFDETAALLFRSFGWVTDRTCAGVTAEPLLEEHRGYGLEIPVKVLGRRVADVPLGFIHLHQVAAEM